MLLAHLPRELLSLLPQFRLLTREPLEPASHLLGAQPIALFREVFLLTGQLFLAPGELADSIEAAVSRALLPLLGALLRLVIGLLLPLQLAVESVERSC